MMHLAKAQRIPRMIASTTGFGSGRRRNVRRRTAMVVVRIAVKTIATGTTTSMTALMSGRTVLTM
jgi:hypothetical protein